MQRRCRLRVASVGLMLHGRRRCPAARDAGAQLILGLAVAPVLRLCHMSNKLVSLTTSSGRKRPSILALWGGVASDPHKVCEIWSRLSNRHVQTSICRGMVWSGNMSMSYHH